MSSSLLEQNTEFGFYFDLNPDCSAVGDINVRVTKQPEHGTVETVAATDYVHFPKENIRFKCNQHKVKGTLVTYKTAEIHRKMSLTSHLYPDSLGNFIST